MPTSDAQNPPSRRDALLLAAAPLLYVLQAVFSLDSRALWFSDEVRHAAVLKALVQNGHWLLLDLGGHPYPDKPPLYFWLQAALSPLTGGVNEQLVFLSAALSGFALLAVTMWAGWTAGGRKTAALSGLALLAMPFFTGITHYGRMDLLFAALIVAAQLCACRALTKPGGSALWAGLLAGLATLVKGPFGIAMPLVSTLAFALLGGHLRRLLRRDFALALLLALALPGAWLAAVGAVYGFGFLAGLLDSQVVARAVDAWHHHEPWYYYFLVLPLAALPWSLPPLFKTRLLLRTGFWSTLWQQRTQAAAHTHLWCCLLGGFVLLSAVSTKTVIYVLPLLPVAAVLCADALPRLTESARARVWLCTGGLLALLGVAVVTVQLAQMAGLAPNLPGGLHGGLVSGGLLLATGLHLLYWRKASLHGLLLAAAAGVCVWAAWTSAVVTPSLDPIMSPKPQAERMGELARQGYAPLVYRVYLGVYCYYADLNPTQMRDWNNVRPFLASHPKAVVALRQKDLKLAAEIPQLTEVHRQVISGQTYVLMTQGGD